MTLCVGTTAAAITPLLLAGLIVFVGWTLLHRGDIRFWGRRTLFLALYGLVICCFAAARDGLDKTIQCAIDASCAPGVFSLVSTPTIVGCIGAAVILLAGLITIFTRSQSVKAGMFYLMTGGVAAKILVVELARLLA